MLSLVNALAFRRSLCQSAGRKVREGRPEVYRRGEIEYREPLNTGVPPSPAFSRVVCARGMVYVSGTGAGHHWTGGSGIDGSVALGTATEETRWAMEALQRVLAEVGSSLDNVVSMSMLLTDKADYAEVNAEYVSSPLLGLFCPPCGVRLSSSPWSLSALRMS